MVLAESIEFKHGLYKSCGMNVSHGNYARTMFTPTMFSRGRDPDICQMTRSWHASEIARADEADIMHDLPSKQETNIYIYIYMYICNICIYIYIYIHTCT